MKYYLQDTRSWAGNIMLWWKRGGHGYTTNIDEAEIWTAEELEADGYNIPDHPKYKIWEKEYIDSLVIKVVDQHSTDCDKAGIKKFKYNCHRNSKLGVVFQTNLATEVDKWINWGLEFGEGREVVDENGKPVEEFLPF